jgi:RNA recognition motif-containing protein
MGSKVFVGNLEFKTTQGEVEELFSQAGSVREVFLPADRATGRPRGFAFVEYESEEDAARAIEKFDGYELGGRALRVNQAEDRPGGRRGGPPFGGGPPGGGRGPDRFGGGKPKGSRRNVRARKRSL